MVVGGVYITAGVVSLAFLRPVLLNRDRPGSSGFLLVVVGIAGWSVCNGLNKFVATLSVSVTLTKFVLLSAQLVGIGWILLAGEYTGRVRLTRRLGALVGVYFVGWQSLVWTNHSHHLFLASTTRMSGGLLVPVYNVGFWVFVSATYILVIVGTAVLIDEGRRSSGMRRDQALILASSLLPPVIANLVTLSPAVTVQYDLTPLGFIGSAVLFLWALYGSRFLEIRPAARRTVVKEIDDAILTVNDDDLLVDYNPAAADLFDIDDDALGTAITDAVGALAETSAELPDPDGGKTEITVTEDEDRHFQLGVSELDGDSDTRNGRVVVLREITSLKRQQRQLREREREIERQNDLFRKSQDVANVGAWEYDTTAGTLRWSDQTYRIHDLPREREVTIEDALEFYHPDDRSAVREALTEAIEAGESYDVEARLVTATDDQRWVRIRGDPQAENGSVVRIRGTIQDITGRKRREQELQEQTERLERLTGRLETQYRHLFEEAPVMAAVTRAEAGEPVIEDCNQLFADTLGYEKESLIGRALAELYTAESERRLFDEGGYDRAMSGKFRREERTLVTADGETVETLLRAVPREGPREDTAGTLAMYVDISKRRDLQREKARLEELYVSARTILGKESREQMSAETVQTVRSVLGFSGAGVHLYDREAEALKQVAQSDQISDTLQEEPVKYTDRETVVWEVYESGEPVRIDDTRTFEGTLPNEETPTRSAVIVPIGVHGVLIASALEPDVFGEEDVYFLRLLCQFVGIALDRAANDQRLVATQNTIQEALYAETHEGMADTVLEEMPEALDLPIAGIWKHQPARQTLEPLGMTEKGANLFDEQPAFPEGQSLAWQTFETGSTSIVSDVSEHPEAYNPETPIKGEIIVPIGQFGVLIAGSTYKRSFTRIDANILEILAGNIEAIAQVIQQRREIHLFDQVIDRILRHNVRNRLTPIFGYANEIVEEGQESVEPYAKNIVDVAEELKKTSQHAREMRRVVQNIDSVVTIQLGDIVTSAVETLQENRSDGEIVVTIETNPEVTAHPELETAIRHLVRNGLEHNTSEFPRVTLTVTDTAAGPTVRVVDNGPGIDTHELDVLEEHGESALQHGTGAGLWIVDRVIEYSEALLDFETADGTTVTITFPEV